MQFSKLLLAYSGVSRFRLGNEVLIACGGLLVGLLNHPINKTNAETKVYAADFSVQPELELAIAA